MEKLQGRVLLVDDEPRGLRSIERRLQRLGIVTAQARNGLEALRLIRKQPFDLVITDTDMPYMDGLSLLVFLKSRRSKLPVIVMFPHSWETDLSRNYLESLGARAVLEKERAGTLLAPLLKEFLEGKKSQDEMARAG